MHKYFAVFDLRIDPRRPFASDLKARVWRSRGVKINILGIYYRNLVGLVNKNLLLLVFSQIARGI